MILDLQKVRENPEMVYPPILADLVQALKQDDLWFLVPALAERGAQKVHVEVRASYFSLIICLATEGKLGKYNDEHGWGMYLGSITTLLTIMVADAAEAGRVEDLDEDDIPFGENHQPDEDLIGEPTAAELAEFHRQMDAWDAGEHPF